MKFTQKGNPPAGSIARHAWLISGWEGAGLKDWVGTRRSREKTVGKTYGSGQQIVKTFVFVLVFYDGDKLPQTKWLKTRQMYYLIISAG